MSRELGKVLHELNALLLGTIVCGTLVSESSFTCIWRHPVTCSIERTPSLKPSLQYREAMLWSSSNVRYFQYPASILCGCRKVRGLALRFRESVLMTSTVHTVVLGFAH
jgi:hypothetical protein